jgi:UDP:flavonoid glycosyltransferase YjiC (YdhE family)
VSQVLYACALASGHPSRALCARAALRPEPPHLAGSVTRVIYLVEVRILVSTQPAYGHLHPLVPIAAALNEAGHDVALASSRSFQSQLKATGLRSITAGLDWLESEVELAFPDMVPRIQAGTTKQFAIEQVFCSRTARRMAGDIIELAETWRPDIVLREYCEFGGGIAAKVLGIPCVLHGFGLWRHIDEFVEIGGAQLRCVAAEAGVIDDDLKWLDGDLLVDACPPFLQDTSQRPYPARSQLIRPVPFDTTTGPSSLPSWAADVQDNGPVVYVGLGTVMNRRGGTLEAILDDLVELEATLVVTTGPGRLPADFGPQPSHVHIEPYLPLTQLLPHCDLVVCHAGWGTMIGALAHGLPLVCVPMGADQFMNAERCVAAGVGPSIAATELRPGMIRDTASAVLDQPAYRTAARRAQAQIDEMPRPDQVVHAVEALA